MEPSAHESEAQPLALAALLNQIARDTGPDRLSFSELAHQLDARAWGGLLVIFATINAIPLPPGVNIFFAIPLMIVSAQMVAGRESPWFPARINRRGVTKDELRRLVIKLEPLERRIERLFKPRLLSLTGAVATRVIAIVCFLLALLTTLPVVHVAPAAVIILFGVALLYRDGALVIAAAVSAIAGISIGTFLLASGAVAVSHIAHRFGF